MVPDLSKDSSQIIVWDLKAQAEFGVKETVWNPLGWCPDQLFTDWAHKRLDPLLSYVHLYLDLLAESSLFHLESEIWGREQH